MIEGFYFQNPLYLVTALASLTGLFLIWKAQDREGVIVGLSRAVLFLFLGLSIASPHVQSVQEVQKNKELVVLKDTSRSSDIIDENIPALQDVDLKERKILDGNNSRLADALRSELRANTSYLLLSDGRTSQDLKKVLKDYRAQNSSISVLKPDISDEKAVRITGPSTTVPGALNTYTVHISSTETAKTPLKVTMDGKTVFQGRIRESWTFNRTFEEKETHKIKATIQASDRIEENNRYYKTVEVRKKPQVLFIGKRSDLTKKLSDFYELDIRETLPEEIKDYYSVLSTRPLKDAGLASYISRGNGYMYLGSYEHPAAYLPVQASDEDYDTESTRVVIGMETSSQAGSSIRDSKDLAYALVEELPLNTKLAAFYYSQDVHLLGELTTLAYNREELLRKISSIQSIAETRHGKGLKAAKQLADGKGNIVIFTDGNFFEEKDISREEIRQNAFAEASDTGVNLYIVGVGEDPNRDFLREVAERAPRGEYYPASDLWRLGFRFGAGGGTSAFKPLAVIEKDHFITEDIRLDSSVSLFDEVRPRTGADVLVSGPGKREFLTSWQYGLGRVAAFSGGQPMLSRVLSSDPGLISRTVSWTVGNPERKGDEWIRIENTESPEKPEVTASYPAKNLTYSSKDRYTGTIQPSARGFNNYSGKKYAYNYNSEVAKIGYRDSLLSRIASSTGGEVLKPTELKGKKFGGTQIQEVSSSRPLAPYLLAAALIVFLIEVGYRKLNGRK